jgi:creatinine amidohydrolase
MLHETVAEMARNGCKKILIVNGHGGNTALIQYFGQTQLDSPKDYIVYSFSGMGGNQADVDGHAEEGEISNVMASRPELVHADRAGEGSGANLRRLDLPTGVFTAIFWYASFPNHYQGDAAASSATRGAATIDFAATRLANAIRAVKADQNGPRLQNDLTVSQTAP